MRIVEPCGVYIGHSGGSKYRQDDDDLEHVEDVVDDDVRRHKLVKVQPTRRHHPSGSGQTSKSSSLTQRVEKARSVSSLLRAVNRAAMRVNPTDPDAFLSLLSARQYYTIRYSFIVRGQLHRANTKVSYFTNNFHDHFCRFKRV